MTVPDYNHKFQCLKTGEVYLAVCCFTSFQFHLEIVGFEFFFLKLYLAALLIVGREQVTIHCTAGF